MGQWGTLPGECIGLKPAQGPSPLQTSGAVPFWSLSCCVIELGFTLEDELAIFYHYAVFNSQRDKNV